MTEHKSLVAAQLAVMAAVPYLQKRQAKDLPYTFAGEADLIRAVRGAMIENGLTLTPIGAEEVYSAMRAAKSGKEMPHIRLRLTYRLAHHPSGEHIDIQTVGESLDTSDKAANKAMTAGLKYCVRQAFLIETGDDPDVVAHFRDSENADWIAVAVNKLNACKTLQALDEQCQRFRGLHPETGEALFTEEQLSELDLYAARHRKKLDKA